MKKGAIIGIGIGIIIAAIAAIYAVSSVGIEDSGQAGIGLEEKIESSIDEPEDKPILEIKETVKEGIGVEGESNP